MRRRWRRFRERRWFGPPSLQAIAGATFLLTLVAGAMGGMWAWNAWIQWRAMDWPTVPGEMLESRVAVSRDRHRTTYTLDMRYRYTVDGTSHVGRRYHATDWSSSSRQWREKVVAAFPEGATVPVYYDPESPQFALLSPGLGPQELSLGLWVPLLVAAWVGLLAMLWYRWRWRRTAARVAGDRSVLVLPPEVTVSEEGGVTRVRAPERGPLGTALGAAFLAAAGGGIAGTVAWIAGAPGPLLLGGVMSLPVIAGVGAAWWRGRGLAAGRADLVLDRPAGTLTLPRPHPAGVTISLQDFDRIQLAARGVWRGIRLPACYTALLVRAREGADEIVAELCAYFQEGCRAGTLAAWFAAELELDPPRPRSADQD